MNTQQILAICGMASPVVYTAMWILGGKLQSDYNHIRDDISSLFAVGAANKRLMQSFIVISSVLLFLFYIGLHEGLGDEGGSIVGPALFVTASVMGIFVAGFFPLDEGGEFVTLRGKMHIILVVAMGILTIAGMVALWFRLHSVEEWSAFGDYSLISAIVALILMVISGIFVAGRYRGLLERLGVTPFQLYYFILPMMVYLNN